MTYTLYMDLQNLSCRQPSIVTSASEIVVFTLLQSNVGTLEHVYTGGFLFSSWTGVPVRSSPPTNSQTLEVATIMCMSLHLITTYSTHKKHVTCMCILLPHIAHVTQTVKKTIIQNPVWHSLTKHTKIIITHQGVSDFYISTSRKNSPSPWPSQHRSTVRHLSRKRRATSWSKPQSVRSSRWKPQVIYWKTHDESIVLSNT